MALFKDMGPSHGDVMGQPARRMIVVPGHKELNDVLVHELDEVKRVTIDSGQSNRQRRHGSYRRRCRCRLDRSLPKRSDAWVELSKHKEQIGEWLGCKEPLHLRKIHKLLLQQGVETSYRTLRRFVIQEFGWKRPDVTILLEEPEPGLEVTAELMAVLRRLRFLFMVLSEEVNRRDSYAIQNRIQEARLGPRMTLIKFDSSSKITYDKILCSELCSLRFIQTHNNVIILGPVVVGITFLTSTFGNIACTYGYRVHMIRADDMQRNLRGSRLDNSRTATMTELTSIDLLIVDDFAIEPMTRK